MYTLFERGRRVIGFVGLVLFALAMWAIVRDVRGGLQTPAELTASNWISLAWLISGIAVNMGMILDLALTVRVWLGRIASGTFVLWLCSAFFSSSSVQELKPMPMVVIVWVLVWLAIQAMESTCPNRLATQPARG